MSFAEMSTANGLKAWAGMIAGMWLSYGSTETVANSHATTLL